MPAVIVQILADGRPGGGTTAVLNLCCMLAAQREHVVMITQRNSYLTAKATAAGLTVIGLDFSRRLRTVALAVEIAQLLKQLDPAVLHAHGARAALPIALIPKRVAGFFAYTVHGFHYLHKPAVVSRLARCAEALCIARADCTVFVSDGDFEIAKSSGLLARSKAQITIKNAISMDDIVPAEKKSYDIGFLGRLHPQKNPLILVDILKAMRPLRPSLCVIGGGALADQLRSRIDEEGLSDQVTLCGELDRTEALRILSACNVLVLPSRWEGHPIALIEAMHLGLPVVASDIPGNDEIVVNGESGYLVPGSDAAAYADCLSRLLADPALCGGIGDNARQRAGREYSVGHMVDAHRQIYRLTRADPAACLRPA